MVPEVELEQAPEQMACPGEMDLPIMERLQAAAVAALALQAVVAVAVVALRVRWVNL